MVRAILGAARVSLAMALALFGAECSRDRCDVGAQRCHENAAQECVSCSEFGCHADWDMSTPCSPGICIERRGEAFCAESLEAEPRCQQWQFCENAERVLCRDELVVARQPRELAARKSKLSRAQKLNASTNQFLESLNSGPLTFGQMLAAIREAEEQSLAQFASRLAVSRQHLHQLESGQKHVSPERAVRFARILGHSEVYFVQLAPQDLVDDAGVSAKVEVKVA
jgi:plasmid maintenance system antidote protein VapI